MGKLILPIGFVKDWQLTSDGLGGTKETEGVHYITVVDFAPRKDDVPRMVDAFGRALMTTEPALEDGE